MTTRRVFAAIAAAALLSVLALPGRSDEAQTPAKITRVETKKVCMVNNTLFQKDQIPVQVEGKTYYGCCEMCKERLAKDAGARAAVDPVTGKPVDKATAVIGALDDGSVLYFENEATFTQYSGGGAKQGGR